MIPLNVLICIRDGETRDEFGRIINRAECDRRTGSISCASMHQIAFRFYVSKVGHSYRYCCNAT